MRLHRNVGTQLVVDTVVARLSYEQKSVPRFLARALVPQAHGSKSSERPRPGVYQECLEKAEADQEETVVSGVIGMTRVLQY